jgi:hypothetical protein
LFQDQESLVNALQTQWGVPPSMIVDFLLNQAAVYGIDVPAEREKYEAEIRKAEEKVARHVAGEEAKARLMNRKSWSLSDK